MHLPFTMCATNGFAGKFETLPIRGHVATRAHAIINDKGHTYTFNLQYVNHTSGTPSSHSHTDPLKPYNQHTQSSTKTRAHCTSYTSSPLLPTRFASVGGGGILAAAIAVVGVPDCKRGAVRARQVNHDLVRSRASGDIDCLATCIRKVT